MPRLFRPDKLFDLGGRLPLPLGNGLATLASQSVGRFPPASIQQWAQNLCYTVGIDPDPSQYRDLVRHWVVNNLWSMSLGRWTKEAIDERTHISESSLTNLFDGLSGSGLILALPHMGSWDLAGAWCAKQGIQVVSVAEKLPGGLFEKFRFSREQMGMIIYPHDELDLLEKLAEHVKAGHTVCLLCDRDLTRHGMRVQWPTGNKSLVPAGPYVLAQRTDAEIRVASAAFLGSAIHITVGENLVQKDMAMTAQAVVTEFSTRIITDPTSWLCLQPIES